MEINLKQVKKGKDFPMDMVLRCENMEDFCTITVATELESYLEILNYKGEHPNYKKSMTAFKNESYGVWLKKIKLEHDAVMIQVLELLRPIRDGLFPKKKGGKRGSRKDGKKFAFDTKDNVKVI